MNDYTKHDTNIPINGTMLKKKAMEICIRLDITGFSTSDGSIDSFIKRQDFAYRLVKGESANVDQVTVADWKRDELSSPVENYTLQNILNVNEISLVFNLLPGNIYIVNKESCDGRKLSKECLSVLLCCNSGGS